MQQSIKEQIRHICEKRDDINHHTLEDVIFLAIQIAREGREGRKIGTMFIVSDSDAVLQRSRTLILDPLSHHPEHLKSIANQDMRETIKELAQLDGAFIVSNAGVVLSACRYINASSEDIDLPLGLGSRHIAGASITRETDAIAIVVSESSIIRIFDAGEMVAEIIPELWLLDRYGIQITGKYTVEQGEDITVASKEEEPS